MTSNKHTCNEQEYLLIKDLTTWLSNLKQITGLYVMDPDTGKKYIVTEVTDDTPESDKDDTYYCGAV